MLPQLTLVFATALGIVFSFADLAQAQLAGSNDAQQSFFESLSFRSLGPYRGGRSAATSGVADNPMLYYMGAAGGGVWKTEDAGSSWENISDGFFGGSIGSIAVKSKTHSLQL